MFIAKCSRALKGCDHPDARELVLKRVAASKLLLALCSPQSERKWPTDELFVVAGRAILC
jgi:hypothetical protein